MSIVKRTCSLLALLVWAGGAAQGEDPAVALRDAQKRMDEGAMSSVQQTAVAAVAAAPKAFETLWLAAESFRVHAEELRMRRLSGEATGDAADALQQRASGLALEGLPYAERALKSAKNDAERAKAGRVLGELYSHQITGMISGMRNGPKARTHCEAALALAPEDPECLRTVGLMQLSSPSFAGGDLEAALSTYAKCAALEPENDGYHFYLALAHQALDHPKEAREAAAEALRLNPANTHAAFLLKALEK